MREIKHTSKLWSNISKPFFALAPMADVTDFAFREMIAKYGKPNIIWTEFVSADGLASIGKKKLLINLKYSEKQRPIIAQLFTSHPEAMAKASALVADLGFDGLDINMGCPDRKIEKQGGGSALMKNQRTAIEILRAAREYMSPVSVKTRLGYNKIDFEWIKLLLQQKLPALTIHLRTRKEMSDVPAHWEIMPEIVKLRDLISPRTILIGNGDVESMEDGLNKIKKSGCDGVMVGRGIFGQPWFFSTLKAKSKFSNSEKINPATRLKILVDHAKLFEKSFISSDQKRKLKNFDVMKKHFKAYICGWDGAKDLRVRLMSAKNASEVKKIVDGYLSHNRF